MSFPASWPPRPSSALRSIRFFVDGIATADFEDSAYLLRDAVQKLNYAAQAAAFTPSETITGQLSAATALVVADDNAGATGTLTLREVFGFFEPAEQILGSVTGDATTNGVPTFPANTYTSLPEIRAGVQTLVPPAPWGTGYGSSGGPHPMIWSGTIRIVVPAGGFNDLEYSMDGVNVHGEVKPGEDVVFRNRSEAGIAVRGVSTPFWIESW